MKLLYAHGYDSGPDSKKGVAVATRVAGVERLDLRVPAPDRLSLGAMIATVRAAIGGPRDRAIVIGSSLGGLTAARAAEQDPRICALVLLAPAFRFAERVRARLTTGPWIDVDEAAAIDVGLPDVRVPTLILHGVNDEIVPIDLSRDFAAGKRWVRLIELDDGHDLLASLPRILDEVEAFVSGRRPAGSRAGS